MDTKLMNFWKPDSDWLSITTIDCHTEGEPFRVITGGIPEIPGNTILDKRRFAKNHLDHLRKALMWEPRGHADMYGCILTPPVTPGADFGVLFLHNEGFSTMCGHGIIGITTVVLETGLLPKTEPVTELKIDSPAGLIHARAHVEDQRVRSVSFRNVPSFVLELDRKVTVPGLGEVAVDLAFGGAFYAYTSASVLGFSITGTEYRPLIEAGMAIKHAVMESGPISHPVEPDLSFLYGTILTGPPVHRNSHSRNVCVFAEGEVDRSPTGTGVSGRLAIHHARGEIGLHEAITIESIIGSRFTGTVVEETRFGPYPAVIPEVTGTAFITGMHRFLIDPDDPWKSGFFLR